MWLAGIYMQMEAKHKYSYVLIHLMLLQWLTSKLLARGTGVHLRLCLECLEWWPAGKRHKY